MNSKSLTCLYVYLLVSWLSVMSDASEGISSPLHRQFLHACYLACSITVLNTVSWLLPSYHYAFFDF